MNRETWNQRIEDTLRDIEIIRELEITVTDPERRKGLGVTRGILEECDQIYREIRDSL